VGKAFLYNQGCYLVDTEVKLNLIGLKRFQELDTHSVIDVCGVGVKYISGRKKTRQSRKEFKDLEISNIDEYSFGYNILRGIEVKVSRSDFKNGFVCSGCNYNYVFTPMRLLAQYEVPSGVGLIEYNKHKFSCELHSLDASNTTRRTFRLSGVRVVKKPAYRVIPQFQIDNAVSNISLRQLDLRMEILEEEILDFEH
jgi:hypothetical protein